MNRLEPRVNLLGPRFRGAGNTTDSITSIPIGGVGGERRRLIVPTLVTLAGITSSAPSQLDLPLKPMVSLWYA
jgi:hypothetical protein